MNLKTECGGGGGVGAYKFAATTIVPSIIKPWYDALVWPLPNHKSSGVQLVVGLSNGCNASAWEPVGYSWPRAQRCLPRLGAALCNWRGVVRLGRGLHLVLVVRVVTCHGHASSCQCVCCTIMMTPCSTPFHKRRSIGHHRFLCARGAPVPSPC
jgi:hypothetical protein